MSFIEDYSKFQKLRKENEAWKLLCSNNAPFILAFLSDVFAKETSVQSDVVKAGLTAVLKKMAYKEDSGPDRSANDYLREWMHANWLRKSEGYLYLTDASQSAINIANRLEDRTVTTTASHLKVVQDAVRDFSAVISKDPQEIIQNLKLQRDELNRKIKDVQEGNFEVLSRPQMIEQMKEIYQLSSLLTNDFLKMEEDIRANARELKVRMVNSDETRGELLSHVLSTEQSLLDSEAGSAFSAFYELLCDGVRTDELQEQIKKLLSDDVSMELTDKQRLYMKHLLSDLNSQSDRVFKIRRRTEQSLRNYIEQTNFEENKTVDRLLKSLEGEALKFKDGGVDLRQSLDLSLITGPLDVNTPAKFRLKQPEQEIDTSLEENQPLSNPSLNVLNEMCGIDEREVFGNVKRALVRKGPMSLSEITRECPVKDGVEEVVCLLRLANKTMATRLDERETLIVSDGNGKLLQVKVDKLIFNPNHFPEDIEELIVE